MFKRILLAEIVSQIIATLFTQFIIRKTPLMKEPWRQLAVEVVNEQERRGWQR